MSEITLVKPSKELQEAIWEYRNEFLSMGENHINGSCNLAGYADFDEWLNFILSLEKALPKGYVKSETYLSVRKSDGKIVGSIQLRCRLNKELRKCGGHIGYGIRPTERQKGYGKEQLLLVLEQARKLNISKIIIFCDKDNKASARTALSCGAFLKGENEFEGKAQFMFYIDLAKKPR